MILLDLIRYFVVVCFFGILPIYMPLKLFGINKRHSFTLALGFSPALIAFFNIIFVLCKLQHGIIPYFTIFSINSFFFVVGFKISRLNINNFKTIFTWKKSKLLIISIGIGVFYWLVGFFPFILRSSIYHDVLFNFTIIAELKEHFLPINPIWNTSSVMLYHFLTDLYLAGMMNFAGLDIIHTVNLGNLFTCISIVVLIYLSFQSHAIINFFVLFLLVLVRFTPDWFPISGFGDHITGYAASTFFWSLPILLTTIYIWNEFFTRIRLKITVSRRWYVLFLLIVFTTTLIAFFAKVTIVAVLVGLEFYSFLKFCIDNSVFTLRSIRNNFRIISSYILVPVFSVVLSLIISMTNTSIPSGGLNFGLELDDFSAFNSWNPVYPILAMYGSTIIVIFLSWSQESKFRFELLFASVFNLVLFFIFKHTGGSDVFFGFNAFICNFLFVVYSDIYFKLKKVVISFFIMALLVTGIHSFTDVKGLSLAKIVNIKIAKPYGPDVYENIHVNQKIQDLMDVSKELPTDALIATTGYENERHFTYSAFIGRRFWNESSVYAMSTLNAYAPLWQFQSRQSFIPSFFTETPNIDNETAAYNKFVKDEFGKYLHLYENPKLRTEIFNKAVFEEQSDELSENTAKKYKWTHILIEKKDLYRINSWLKNKHAIVKDDFTIFVL